MEVFVDLLPYLPKINLCSPNNNMVLLTFTHIVTILNSTFMSISDDTYHLVQPSTPLTLLGLGLIKINDVSANFNNPRPSLISNA